ncbi:MAG TPA: hypothetical protein VFJ82_23150, partial [Longimicrobium sp.]|nr:hypothetical protein [Longimicrobium sp.]
MTRRPVIRVFAAPAAALLAAAGCGRAAPEAARAAEPAAAWSAPVAAPALTDALGRGARHEAAALAATPDGVVHAVFAADQDGDGWADALRYARLQDGRWSAPETVKDGAGLAEDARLAVDGDGVAHVLWLANLGGGVAAQWPTAVMERRRGPRGWEAARTLYREPGTHGMPARSLGAATGPDGVVEVLFPANGKGVARVRLRGAARSPAAFIAEDGRSLALSQGPARAPLALAFVAERVSPAHPRAESDVFARTLRGGGWSGAAQVHAADRRYSHHPQAAVDARGTLHLVWLEDTDGSVFPEAVFHATSAGGAHWSAARDVTPAALRGGVPLRAAAVADGAGTVHVLLRATRAGDRRPGLYHFALRGGVPGTMATLAAPGDMGPGSAQAVYDVRRRTVVALWRGMDGV